MPIKSEQVYYSRTPYTSFDQTSCSLLFVPDKRKGGAFGPNGEKIMMSAHQRRLLEHSPLTLHHADNAPALKEKMLHTQLKIHPFPENMTRAGFGVGLLVKKDTNAILQPEDIISILDTSELLNALKAPIEKHNAKVQAKAELNATNESEENRNIEPVMRP